MFTTPVWKEKGGVEQDDGGLFRWGGQGRPLGGEELDPRLNQAKRGGKAYSNMAG